MSRPVNSLYQAIDVCGHSFARLATQFEVDLLPPYGDSEVNLVGEAGISAATDILLSAVVESLDE